jgi:hypothetical protein
MSKPIAYLFESNRSTKKYAMFFPASVKVVYFGQKPYRDYTLINDKKSVHYLSSKKERDAVKNRYRARHANDNLDQPESAGSLSMEILWSLRLHSRGGIRNYSRKYNLRVVDKTSEEYSPDKVKELISS